ncbi:unnamed protein product [Meloidogyne enterolobii]|uniref:Uncharacterized protein n=1 Tax=Meloidogyne enterolobii TaxID=390850 RepID=A0ACB0XTL9_MELEN
MLLWIQHMLLKPQLERLFNEFKNSFKKIFLTCSTRMNTLIGWAFLARTVEHWQLLAVDFRDGKEGVIETMT